jgi:hypothetical protein
VERYWLEFWSVVEQCFGDLAAAFPVHAYATTIIRLGPQGVLTVSRPADATTVTVLRPEDFDPPLADISIATVMEATGATSWTFDSRFRSYSEDEARIRGARNAFHRALGVFWQGLEPASFGALCRDLAVAEGLSEERLRSESRADDGLDLVGNMYFDEPGRFVREEVWGFQLLDYDVGRPSASAVGEAVAKLGRNEFAVDILCLVSVRGLTSVGRKISLESARIRVWDHAVMDILLHKHPEIMRQYFRPYVEVLERLQSDARVVQPVEARYRAALESCPTGQRDFQTYEELGTEILGFLFQKTLGEPRVQTRTADGVERRDVVCRNNRDTRFFQRIGERFEADFVIWDFKNHGKPISGVVINDVAIYANPALGKFIIVVSRHGGSDSARAAQLRRLRNDRTVILIVSDQQLLEMIQRKERGNTPEDLLEDLLDELLLEY